MNTNKIKNKIDKVWDRMCLCKPTVIQSPKTLSYSFVDGDMNNILTLTIKELMLMDKSVQAFFKTKTIDAETAMGEIGLWCYRD